MLFVRRVLRMMVPKLTTVKTANATAAPAQTAAASSAEAIGRELEQQLLLGERLDKSSESPTMSSSSTTGRVQAGFISVRMEDYDDNSNNRLDGGEPLSQRVLQGALLALQKTGAPIVITFPVFELNYQTATTIFASVPNKQDLIGKVVLTGMCGGGSRPIEKQIELLRKGFVLCFDCFGRVEWLSGASFCPSDEESAVRIAELMRMGFAKQIVISQGVSRRIHLSRCGGFGYAHAMRTVPPRLRRLGVSTEDITSVLRDNALRLLDWYTPPPPAEIHKDYLPCSWCGKRFEPIEGEYFHKFRFVYCGITCLRAHRDTGFKEGVTRDVAATER